MKSKAMMQWTLVLAMVALSVVGCGEPAGTKESISFPTVDCWRLNPQGNVSVVISYPTTIESGQSTDIDIEISNESNIDWDGVRVSFDSSMVPTGDPYFTGLALGDSNPMPTEAWTRSDGVLAWVKWNETAVHSGEEIPLELGLRAVKPGGYGTRITVIVDQNDDFCSIDHVIHTTIK